MDICASNLLMNTILNQILWSAWTGKDSLEGRCGTVLCMPSFFQVGKPYFPMSCPLGVAALQIVFFNKFGHCLWFRCSKKCFKAWRDFMLQKPSRLISQADISPGAKKITAAQQKTLQMDQRADDWLGNYPPRDWFNARSSDLGAVSNHVYLMCT